MSVGKPFFILLLWSLLVIVGTKASKNDGHLHARSRKSLTCPCLSKGTKRQDYLVNTSNQDTSTPHPIDHASIGDSGDDDEGDYDDDNDDDEDYDGYDDDNEPEAVTLKIISSIGKGAFGVVYHVTMNEVSFALKSVPKFTQVDKGPDADTVEYGMTDLDSLVSEILAADLLGTNPFTTTLYRVLFDNDNYYMLMELMPNGDCERLHCQTMENVWHIDNGIAKRLLSEVACALKLVHSHGIVHGDIKTDNIMITRNGHFKLGDFGIARRIEESMPPLRPHAFHPPEVHRGNAALSQSGDIWSLGITLFFILTDSEDQVYQTVPLGSLEQAYPELHCLLAMHMLLPEPTARITAEGLVGNALVEQWLRQANDDASLGVEGRQQLEWLCRPKTQSTESVTGPQSMNVPPEDSLGMDKHLRKQLADSGSSFELQPVTFMQSN